MGKKILWTWIFMASLAGALWAQASPYDEMFKNVTADNYSILVQALDSADLNMVYSAVKRIGELKITNAKPRIEEWLGMSNPESTRGKQGLSANYKKIFNISIWTIGRIGDDNSAKRLGNYWIGISDPQTQILIVEAWGNLTGAPSALTNLNELTRDVTDERIAYAVVDAVLKHNSRSSILPLLRMSSDSRVVVGKSGGGSFSPKFKAYVSQAIAKLSKEGKD